MAAIIERQGRYLVRVRRAGFKPVAKTFTIKKDAQAYGRMVEADMESGRWVAETTRAPSLRDAIKTYRTTVAPAMKGATTYRYRFDEFEALPFAHKLIDKVTAADFATWRDAQCALHKPGTVVRKLAMLSAIFGWARTERGWLAVNPLSAVRKPRVSDSRSRVMSDDEVAYLMAAAMTSKARWLAAAVTIALHSAMRRGELFGLKRGDIDFDAAVAHLSDTKAGCSRDVPLCPRSLSALRELDADASERGEDALLPFGQVGSLSTRFKRTVHRARAMYEADCAASGSSPDDSVFFDLRWHDLRHCAVTTWATTGALSLPELMSVSGHKTPCMLARYTHLSASSLATKLAGISV